MYLSIGAIVMFAFIIYVFCKLHFEGKASDREREQELKNSEERRKILEDQRVAEEALEDALKQSIYNEVSHLNTTKGLPRNYTVEQFSEIVMKNKHYVGINSPADIFPGKIDSIKEIILFAQDELLDYCSNARGQLVRLTRCGEIVPISEDEFQKMCRHEYDFILNDPRNKQ